MGSEQSTGAKKEEGGAVAGQVSRRTHVLGIATHWDFYQYDVINTPPVLCSDMLGHVLTHHPYQYWVTSRVTRTTLPTLALLTVKHHICLLAELFRTL